MAIANVPAFATSWWAWWHWISPVWRKDVAKSSGSHCYWVEREQGSWLALKMPGKNGFLSVLACLKWWRESVTDGDFIDWDTAVRDVAWAMQSLLAELVPSKYVLRPYLFILLNPFLSNRKRSLMDVNADGDDEIDADPDADADDEEPPAKKYVELSNPMVLY